MAELEVAKNVKKVIKITQEKNNWFHKLKHILLEICIIIFAVSVSIGFHNWSENRHEQKEVHDFMLGFKQDLKKDIIDMQSDIKAYKQQKRLFKYIATIPNGQRANQDSIKKFKQDLFNFTSYGKNSGRYEGFKSSGKLYFIENDYLLDEILNYYEEDITLLNISTTFYKNQKLKFADYIIENSSSFPDGDFLEVISSPKIKNRSKIYLSAVDAIINSYNQCIHRAQAITQTIEKDYH
ncbi:DUF6090 family protein [Elizabethkingia sp. JS20170427COW]|uniref:DUF6090 family protein n=1 Tax=Elizabethkingia sp. JS20170427COW TaxID=2583851 RepID=UPI001110DBA5|nr:DUF6090 family protein [Elizabethkingia sp. JS20170427COW]QCX52699.1 hypothetical protein FGE20_02525 [Elizabethkingia sp. JS20170427COW]